MRGGWVQELPSLNVVSPTAFHVGLHPTLEHIDHLEVDVMEMQL